MKLLHVAALLLTFHSAWIMAGQPNQAAATKQNDSNGSHPATLTPSNKSTAQDATSTDDHPPHWYTSLKRPEWWLVVAGFLAVVVAWRTLNAIDRQVMTFTSKERGRLAVELAPFEIGPLDEPWFAGLLVTNHGSTKAFIEKTGYLPCVESSKWNSQNAAIHLAIGIPQVIAPDQTAPRFDGPIQKGDKLRFDAWDMTQEIVEALQTSQQALFATGYIEYSDVFGNRWRLRFSRRWQPTFPAGTPWYSNWRNYGPPEANEERQIQPPWKEKVLRWLHLR